MSLDDVTALINRLVLLVAAGSVCACGGSEMDDPQLDAGPVIVSAIPFEDARLARVIELATAHWGATPGTLAGWTIVLQPEPVAGCGAHPASGCAFYGRREIRVSLAPEKTLDPACLEASVLAHEIGHAVLFETGRGTGHEHLEWRDAGAWTAYWHEAVVAEGACSRLARSAGAVQSWVAWMTST